jgi:transcriptional regulator with XRE-family HTH domain
MDQKGVKQTELAQRMGLSRAAVSRWFKGDRGFPEDRLEEIAEALEVEVASITEPGMETSDSNGASAPPNPGLRESDFGVGDLRWRFRPAPDDGGQDGGNSNMYATPAGLGTLVREVLQNAGDQIVREGDKLNVQIGLIELRKGSPQYAAFLEALQLTELRAYLEAASSQSFRSSAKIRSSLSRIENVDKLFLMSFSDFNTTGTWGAERSRDDQKKATFAPLVKDNLKSSKSGELQGGAHGLGKATLWRASGLNTVLFSSEIAPGYEHDDRQGTLRFIGKAELTWLEKDAEPYAGPGWISSEGFESVWVAPVSLEPLFLSRAPMGDALPEGVASSGTTALIVDFCDDDQEEIIPSELLKKLELAVAGNFWPRMTQDKWGVEIVHVLDGEIKESITVCPRETKYRPFVEAYEAHLDGFVAPVPAAGDTVRSEVPFTVSGTKAEAPNVGQNQAEKQSSAMLLVRRAEDSDTEHKDILDRIALVRGAGMVVQYWKRANQVVGGKPFHGVLLAGQATATGNSSPDQKASEEFLKFSEPPAHNKWELTEALQQNYNRGAANRIKELFNQATSQLIELIRPDEEGESEQPERFSRLFDIPGVEPKARTAKLSSDPLSFQNGRWELSGKIRILDRTKDIRATIGVQLVPESGRSTVLPLDQIKIGSVIRGQAHEDGDGILITAGTTSVEFTAVCSQDLNLPRMGRCVARPTEHFKQIPLSGEV